MTFKTCPKCGANLDVGEKCDCENIRCEICPHCLSIGGGNHICYENGMPLIVIEEYSPSKNYLYCKKKG